MLNISIKVTGKPIQEFINDLNVTIDQINKDVAMAGKRTLDWMITIIEARKTRSGAEHWDTVPLADALEQSSEVTPTIDGVFVGIGEIAKLNYSAKHWAFCLDYNTEVYVLIDNKIVPIKLGELYKQRDKIYYILTPYGLKYIIGMREVISDNNYKLLLSNRKPIIGSGNHRFLSKLNKNILEKEIQSFPKKALMSYSLLNNTLEIINKENLINSIYIDNLKIDLDFDFGYLIGFCLGDGNVDYKWKKTSIAQKFLNDILPFVVKFSQKYNIPFAVYRIKKDRMWIIQFNKAFNIFKYFIKGVGINKEFNNFYLNTSIEFRKGILAGYKEADGKKRLRNGDRINTISEKLLDQFLNIASSLGYDVSYCKNQNPANIEKYICKNILHIGSYYKKHSRLAYKEKINKIHIERKQDIKGRFISNFKLIKEFFAIKRKINQIEKISGSLVLYDIAVEDELFLIDNGVVSHNCNYGKMRDGNTIPARGKFVPGYWEGDKFIYEPGSGTGMVPKTPIFGLQGGEPINYIEEGENFITKQINDIIAKAKNRMER